MMQVLPILKECQYMKRPSALNEVKLDDVENIEVSLFICLSLNIFEIRASKARPKQDHTSHHCCCIKVFITITCTPGLRGV